jgi:hypothetical protein
MKFDPTMPSYPLWPTQETNRQRVNATGGSSPAVGLAGRAELSVAAVGAARGVTLAGTEGTLGAARPGRIARC